MGKYDFSIIIPIYNAEKYLDECLKSIFHQSYDISKIEIIAINDGSTDHSLDILNKYQNKTNLIIIDKANTGVSDTRNEGLKKARGKYILFLDSDDFISPDTCENIKKTFDKYSSSADILFYKMVRYNEDNKQISGIKRFKQYKKTGLYDLTKDYQYFNPTMNIVVQNKYEENILFDTKYFFHEDEKYNIEILQNKKKVIYCAEAKYYYRHHDESVSSTKTSTEKSYNQYITLYDSLIKDYAQNNTLDKFIEYGIFNDIQWRTKVESFFPNHLDKKEYEEELKRIKRIFKYISDDTILYYPEFPLKYKIFFLEQIKEEKLSYKYQDNKIIIQTPNDISYEEKLNLELFSYEKKNNQITFEAKVYFPCSKKYELYKINNEEKKNLSFTIKKSETPSKILPSIEEAYFKFTMDLNKNEKNNFIIKNTDDEIKLNLLTSLQKPFNTSLKRYLKIYGLKSLSLKTSAIEIKPTIKINLKKEFIPFLISYIRSLKRKIIKR